MAINVNILGQITAARRSMSSETGQALRDLRLTSQARARQVSLHMDRKAEQATQEISRQAKKIAKDAMKVSIKGGEPMTEPKFKNMSPALREYARVYNMK